MSICFPSHWRNNKASKTRDFTELFSVKQSHFLQALLTIYHTCHSCQDWRFSTSHFAFSVFLLDITHVITFHLDLLPLECDAQSPENYRNLKKWHVLN